MAEGKNDTLLTGMNISSFECHLNALDDVKWQMAARGKCMESKFQNKSGKNNNNNKNI